MRSRKFSLDSKNFIVDRVDENFYVSMSSSGLYLRPLFPSRTVPSVCFVLLRAVEVHHDIGFCFQTLVLSICINRHRRIT